MKKILIYSMLIFLVSDCRPAENSAGSTKEHSAAVKPVTGDSVMINFASRINELTGKLTSDFIVKEHSYFVIASNLNEAETEKILTQTIDRAVDCFYNDYFHTKPTEATTIFLFKDDKTYRYWAKSLYDDDDLSKYGYYKPSEKTMLMNINTGTGTLVHEMTHALARYDFPDIPSWFNEGLGSLYERCSLNNKTILGYVNWRLPALQDALADKSYTPIERLMKTNWEEFYGDESDVNYSQARYLCMYLQEQGLLKKYYQNFRDSYNDDNTGIKQMEKITGKSINELDAEYVAWVKSLKYE
ncbi:MAG TPA: hypothetical protein PK605_09645 [Ignavibacteria bacterium]|nr:hypothetical protein [Ignavibacteria bacterium]HRF64888.1 hypothetical protein [Ignavibacteria bacterium]HRJ04650.1 hypothetical protein [Ignavibacteria bacterium]HRJ85074.1 hypothetical protein [Ignavibacteria bacterium]